ncbi:YidC/Oxa1 family membrane protein insertase [Candidatus Saccharibacteria bacterium]|nr:YidC/Oxa1 family membrane protein insertase [Candidatus Saccharibacteria bacterium]
MFDFLDMIIVRPIVNLLFVIFNFVGDFGLAIIIFTIIVKLAMWPLIKKQLYQTRIMRSIQPELAEIKKNCKGNRQLESLQMMDLYKRKNIKPFRSMLTLFIQLPIFIALFTAINVMVRPTGVDTLSVEKSAYSFVRPLDRVNTLVDQQNEYFAAREVDPETTEYQFEPKLFGLVDLSARAGFADISSITIMVFALAAAATQYVMARQQTPSKKKTEKRSFKQIMKEAAEGKQADQTELNSVVSGQMTKFMPIMMLFIMINLPGAIVFYYLLSNSVTVIQQKFILNRGLTEMEVAADKKILKELRTAEEAEIVATKDKKTKENITRIKASNKRRKR